LDALNQGELPTEISNPANYPAVARELKLFLSRLHVPRDAPKDENVL
jgi:hypothetical protein